MPIFDAALASLLVFLVRHNTWENVFLVFRENVFNGPRFLDENQDTYALHWSRLSLKIYQFPLSFKLLKGQKTNPVKLGFGRHISLRFKSKTRLKVEHKRNSFGLLIKSIGRGRGSRPKYWSWHRITQYFLWVPFLGLRGSPLMGGWLLKSQLTVWWAGTRSHNQVLLVTAQRPKQSGPPHNWLCTWSPFWQLTSEFESVRRSLSGGTGSLTVIENLTEIENLTQRERFHWNNWVFPDHKAIEQIVWQRFCKT